MNNSIDYKELDKMDFEEKLMEERQKNYIQKTIDELKELNRYNMEFYFGQPIKYKKPFKVKFKEFIDKLRKVCGV